MNLEVYEAYKPLLLSIAYRMLGSVMDAEDIVQDVFMDWEKVEAGGDRVGRPVEQAKSYLCRMVTNRAIDQLRSAKRRRERYVGVWLPEPVVSDPSAQPESEHSDPLQRLLLRDSLSMAYLVMLESLSPNERAVFLLREIYAYEFDEIADMLGKRPDHCRQLLSRARKRLRVAGQQSGSGPLKMRERSQRGALAASAHEAADEQALARFVRYVTDGNIEGLLGMLTDNAVFISDAGGKVQAAIHPIYGKERVARFVLGIAGKQQIAGLAVHPANVNGAPGIVMLSGSVPYCTMAFAYEEGRIAGIYNMMNPDKLEHIAGRAH